MQRVPESPRKSLLEFLKRVNGASRLGGDGLDNGEQVFGAMGDFAHKKFDALFCDLALAHICHNIDQALSFAFCAASKDLAASR